MLLDVRELSQRDAYRMMIGSIVPRAIGWVSSVSTNGVPNLAPYSFFTGVTSSPPSLVFSPIHRAGTFKDTLRNVAETGEFVVNVATEEVAEAMNATSAELPPEVDEFAVAGLTAVPSVRVRAPRVAESPIQMECRLDKLVEVGRGPGASTLVVGEILAWHIRDDLYDPERSRIRIDRLHAIGRLAGDWYTRTNDQFELVRPNPNYQGR